MKRIIWIPIEPLPERYSEQWNRWFPEEFKKQNVSFKTIDPLPISDKINDGSFLDVCGTNYYKCKQMELISWDIYKGYVTDDDVFFFADAWNPAISNLAYIRDGLGLKFKIVGCLFAGTWDPYDFLTQKGMGYWAKSLEESWFRIVDKFFLATEFHKRLILQSRDVDPKKLIVTGHPMFYEREPVNFYKKEDLVVFPHRLDPEKNPHMFNSLGNEIKTYKFVKTKEVTKNKSEYYDLLDRAKISVSFADQETFGFAMIESLFANCLPLVPNRLSYPELFKGEFLYEGLNDFVFNLNHMMSYPDQYVDSLVKNKKHVKRICDNAIPNMIKECLE